MGILLSSIGGLSGCKKQSAHISDHVKENQTTKATSTSKQKVNSNNTNNKTIQNSNATSSSSDHISNKPKSFQYKIPKIDIANKNYVKSGPLVKKKQFNYDEFGTKTEVSKINNRRHQAIKNGKLEYKILNAKLMNNTVTSDKAKDAVKTAFNLNAVNNHYQTIIINYQITNQHSQSINLNGVQRLSYGSTNIMNNYLLDSGAGHTILPKTTQKFTIAAFILPNTKSASILNLFTGNTYSQNGRIIDRASKKPLRITI